MNFPGIVISALRGGSGKTILSVGIVSAWKKLGKKVVPFKKGPDYIDAGWLALAAGRPCYNLDTFLIDPKNVLSSFQSHITYLISLCYSLLFSPASYTLPPLHDLHC